MMMQKLRSNGQTERDSVSPHIPIRIRFILIATLIVLIISGLYLHYVWHKYQEMASSEAIQLAQSLESLLYPQRIEELSGSAENIEILEYADLNKTITSDIISMSHKLGHCAIAEGVEHQCQLQYLKAHGCDRIQGYLISKPLDEKDAFEFLKKARNKHDRQSDDSPD